MTFPAFVANVRLLIPWGIFAVPIALVALFRLYRLMPGVKWEWGSPAQEQALAKRYWEDIHGPGTFMGK